MTVADPLPLGIEDTYREIAGQSMPAVLDDHAYGFGLSSACALRALSKLHRFDKLDARPPGHHSRPQLVTTIERAVATIDRWRCFDDVVTWLSDMATTLRRRWPDADVSFPDDYTLREPFAPDH